MSFDFGGSSGPGPGGWDGPTVPVSPRSEDVREFGQPHGDDQGYGPPGPLDGSPVSAPVQWLGLGVLAALGGIALHFITDGFPMAAVGWCVGGPVAILLLAAFIHVDTRRRASPLYAESDVVGWARRGLVLLALVAVALNAWAMADVVARGGL